MRNVHREHVRYTPEYDAGGGPIRAKIRFEFGWNQVASTARIDWQGTISLSEGRLLKVTPQFAARHSRRRSGTWKAMKSLGVLVSRITETTDTSVSFDAKSESNPAPMQPVTQSIALDVEMPPGARLVADVNGQQFSYTLGELLEGSRSRFMRGWLTEPCRSTGPYPKAVFNWNSTWWTTQATMRTTTFLRVRQTDHQWAWSSPIWVSAR